VKKNLYEDRSVNLAAILSPDSSRVAFIRNFCYQVVKNRWMQVDVATLYDKAFIYIMDLTNHKLTRVTEIKYSGAYTNISWEGNFLAYNYYHKINVINLDGTYGCFVDDDIFTKSSYDSKTPVDNFTLSPDSQGLYYLLGYHNLHYVNFDDGSKSFEIKLPDYKGYILDMVWDSNQNCILFISYNEVIFGNIDTVYQINPDGTNFRESKNLLEAYCQRRLGCSNSNQLDDLTKNISYKEWGVPAPDKFN